MKRFGWRWLAVSSALCVAVTLHAETRPQYGGTLRMAMRAAPQSLDPADGGQPDSFARRTLTSLLFDRLVSTDETGHLKPALAESWQSSRNQRWQFRLRQGVTFEDGTALSGEIAAASLRNANPSWNVSVEGGALVIELKSPNPDLPAELALPRNAVVKRNAENQVSGTGPFHIVEWTVGKKLKLAAREDYWGGRPFLDVIEIELGRDFRDQMTALELGKADLVEVAPEQARRASQAGRRIVSSAPIDLLALSFSRDFSSPEEILLCEALGLSVERGSIRSVLLQGTGQPTASILPTWMSGYGFVFSSNADLTKARALRGQVHTVPVWKLGYDASDVMGRLIAERIALNARDGGLSLQPTSSGNADVRLVRIPLVSMDPWTTLEDVAGHSGLPVKIGSGSIEELYASEQAALATRRLMPLFHLPVTYASTAVFRNWSVRIDGSLDLPDAWLKSGTP